MVKHNYHPEMDLQDDDNSIMICKNVRKNNIYIDAVPHNPIVGWSIYSGIQYSKKQLITKIATY